MAFYSHELRTMVRNQSEKFRSCVFRADEQICPCGHA